MDVNNNNQPTPAMDLEEKNKTPFTIEDFLRSANLPEKDKEQLVKKYADLLSSKGLSEESQLSLLTEERLLKYGVLEIHAAGIAEAAAIAAQSWGKKGGSQSDREAISFFLLSCCEETQNGLVLPYGLERQVMQEFQTVLTIGTPGLCYDVIAIYGVRRCGKTHLMFQAMKWLVNSNIIRPPEVLYVSLQSTLLPKNLILNDIVLFCKEKGIKYLFLDEIQLLENWDKHLRTAQDSYGSHLRIVVGGSEADLLRSGLLSDMHDRSITIEMKPLSFIEFLQYRKLLGAKMSSEPQELFMYLTYGGFPKVVYYASTGKPEIAVKSLMKHWSAIENKDVRRLLRLSDKETAIYELQQFGMMQSIKSDNQEEGMLQRVVRGLSNPNAELLVRLFASNGVEQESSSFAHDLRPLSFALSKACLLHRITGKGKYFIQYVVDTGLLHIILALYDKAPASQINLYALHTVIFHRLQFLYNGKPIQFEHYFNFCIKSSVRIMVIKDEEISGNTLDSLLERFVGHFVTEGIRHPKGLYAIVKLNKASYPITSAVQFLTSEPINIFDILKNLPNNQRGSNESEKDWKNRLSSELKDSILDHQIKKQVAVLHDLVDEQNLLVLIANQLKKLEINK